MIVQCHSLGSSLLCAGTSIPSRLTDLGFAGRCVHHGYDSFSLLSFSNHMELCGLYDAQFSNGSAVLVEKVNGHVVT